MVTSGSGQLEGQRISGAKGKTCSLASEIHTVHIRSLLFLSLFSLFVFLVFSFEVGRG